MGKDFITISLPEDFDREDFIDKWTKHLKCSYTLVNSNPESRHIYYFFKPELTEGQTMSNYRMIQVNINGEEVDFYSCGGPIQELGNTPFSTAIETIKANPNTLSGEFGIGCTNGGLENYYPTFKYNFETGQVTVNIDNE